MTEGAKTLDTIRNRMIVVRCDECDRTGRYRRETLIERYGPDMLMPDVLAKITESCERRGPGVYERCQARYDEELM